MNIKERALEIKEVLQEKYIHILFKKRMFKDKSLLRYVLKELMIYNSPFYIVCDVIAGLDPAIFI